MQVFLAISLSGGLILQLPFCPVKNFCIRTFAIKTLIRWIALYLTCQDVNLCTEVLFFSTSPAVAPSSSPTSSCSYSAVCLSYSWRSRSASTQGKAPSAPWKRYVPSSQVTLLHFWTYFTFTLFEKWFELFVIKYCTYYSHSRKVFGLLGYGVNLDWVHGLSSRTVALS